MIQLREEEIKLKKDYMQTFGTEAGYRVLKDLESRCYKHDTTFTGSTEETLINEGARQVLLTIENMMSEVGMEQLAEEPKGDDSNDSNLNLFIRQLRSRFGFIWNERGEVGDEPFYHDWEEDIKGNPAIQKFKSGQDLGRGYIELEKKIGAKGVLIPGANATDEEKGAFYNSLGRPEVGDGYQFTLPDELHKDIQSTSESQRVFKEVAHKHGLTQAQAAGLHNWYLNEISNQLKQQEDTDTKSINEAATALRSKWGLQYEQKLGLAYKVIAKFGGAKAQEFLEKGLGNDPVMVQMFASIGELLSEDVLGPGGKSGFGALNPAEAKQKIQEIQGNPNHAYYDDQNSLHDEAVAQMTALYAIAYPS